MISVKNLNFAYPKGDYVLKDISIEINKRSTAIIGQNGAGKTTFVKILKGLLTPASGTVTVLGQDVTRTTVAKLAKTIGLVFQNPNDQIFKKSVLEEVLFGPVNIGMRPDEAKRNSLKAIETVGLCVPPDTNPQDLTLSDKKLLCIASILAMNTDIVILDEPTIAQDWAGKEKIKQLVNLLKSEGKLVMTIVHDMDFVAECFERTVVFNEGGILLDGDTADVFTDEETLVKAHVEPPHVQQLARLVGIKEACMHEGEFISHYQSLRA